MKIVQIANRGVGNQERLHLTVLAETNARYYAVFQTLAITPDTVRALPAFAYWFTNLSLQAGDNVILYSGIGKNTSSPRPDGGKNHFFYCGLPKTIWGPANTRAVLIEINEWETGG